MHKDLGTLSQWDGILEPLIHSQEQVHCKTALTFGMAEKVHLRWRKLMVEKERETLAMMIQT